MNKDLTKVKLVYIHNHNNVFYSNNKLVKYFKNLKFLLCIRNPVSHISSCLNVLSYNKEILDNKNFFSFTNVYIIKMINVLMFSEYIPLVHTNIKDKVKIFKLEDLQTNPEQTIDKIANYLNIKKRDNLYKASLDGRAYRGISFIRGEKVSGFKRRSKYYDEALFSKEDIRYLESLNKKIILEQKYSYISKSFMSKKEIVNYNFEKIKNLSIIELLGRENLINNLKDFFATKTRVRALLDL